MASKSLVLVLVLVVAQSQDLSNRVENERRREELRWFPADSQEDCKTQPGPEQVREGKPSKVCRTDGERFCFCGRVGSPTKLSNMWRFLCGTCKISFKLDRKRIDPSKDTRLKADNVKNTTTNKKRLL